MTLKEVQDEIVLVKSQIAELGGAASKSIDGASVSYDTGSLYRRLQYLEELEMKLLASRRTLRNIDLSNGLDPPRSYEEPEVDEINYVPLTSEAVKNLVKNVADSVFA